MADSKGCRETITGLQRVVQTHEDRLNILDEMRERRREASQSTVKSNQSSEYGLDDSAYSVEDVSSQDEEEDHSVFVKEENIQDESRGTEQESQETEQESQETESEVNSSEEQTASQRRTSARTKRPTRRYGIDEIGVVNSEDEGSEEIRKRMRSLRLFENQTKQWHEDDRKEFNKTMRDSLKSYREQRRRSEEVKE